MLLKRPASSCTRTTLDSVATISRVLKRSGLSRLKALDPRVDSVRYERAATGELLHIDTKKLGRIVRPSHRSQRTSLLPAFLNFYNARRPHSALGFKPPAFRLGRTT